MTKAPKRVWMDGDIEVGEGYWIRCFEDPKPCNEPAIEYVRGDILYNQTHLIGQLFTLLEKTEATDEEGVFHPTTIQCRRVLDAEKLKKILAELKATTEHGGDNE